MKKASNRTTKKGRPQRGSQNEQLVEALACLQMHQPPERHSETQPSRSITFESGKEYGTLAGIGEQFKFLGFNLLAQIRQTQHSWTSSNGTFADQVAAESLRGLGPSNVLEGMLAAQMVAVHAAAMTAMQRAAQSADSDVIDLTASRAQRLMTLFAQQAELLGRLQGNLASQRVVVEKVNIAAGQAIVGVNGAGGTGEGGVH